MYDDGIFLVWRDWEINQGRDNGAFPLGPGDVYLQGSSSLGHEFLVPGYGIGKLAHSFIVIHRTSCIPDLSLITKKRLRR